MGGSCVRLVIEAYQPLLHLLPHQHTSTLTSICCQPLNFLWPEMTSYTLQELQGFGPSSSDPILLGILGVVYDVSTGREFFGPTGPYRIYAGHDATYALASMSLKKSDLDVFEYTLDEDDRQTLADWIEYFRVKYGAIGRLVVTHPIELSELPTGKDPTNLIAMGHPAVQGSEKEKAAFDRQVRQAAGATGAEVPLSRYLILETNDLHEQALRCDFMQAVMQRKVTREQYAPWVAALFHIYTELEHQLQQQSSHPVIRAVDDTNLRRLSHIGSDLEHFYGPNWQTIMPSPTLWTIRYVARISDIAHIPHQLAVHHWMRYGGGLAGGQFLKSALRASLSIEGNLLGVRYHQFDAIGEIQLYYERYLGKLDGVPLSTEERSQMLEEARIAFKLNLELNAEFAVDSKEPLLALADRPTLYSSL